MGGVGGESQGLEVKGEDRTFGVTQKYQKVTGTFAMVPDPLSRDVTLS